MAILIGKWRFHARGTPYNDLKNAHANEAQNVTNVGNDGQNHTKMMQERQNKLNNGQNDSQRAGNKPNRGPNMTGIEPIVLR